MEEQLAALRFLAKEVGPRLSTSAGEAQAAAYVNSRMRQAGLDVEVQTFRAVPTVLLPYGLLYLALILSPLVYYYSRPAALALAVLAVAAFLTEVLTFPVLSSWLPKGESQNVVGTRPAAQEARQHLVVLAHLDSARASLLCHHRLAANAHRLLLLTAALMGLLPVVVGLSWWLNQPWLWYAQWALAGYMLLAFLLLLHGQLLMPRVAGANDNASGVAVLLRLAQELEGLQHTDLWLVATGCKEAGLHGVRQFLRHYPFPRDSTYIVNVDTVGQGELSIIVREGSFGSLRADPYLVELAGRAESGDIAVDADPRIYRLTRSDALVALRRRFRALSVMALKDGRPGDWHCLSDTAENIQPQVLERAARLIVGIARRLDRGATD